MLNRYEKFTLPILIVLARAGGRMYATEAIKEVMAFTADILTDRDYEIIGGRFVREPRAHNDIRWVRQQMVHETRLLRDDSPRGIWEISDAGYRHLEEHGYRRFRVA